MIKVGDKVKIISLHELDSYFPDGIPGSKGTVVLSFSEEDITKINNIEYYAVEIKIDEPSQGLINTGYDIESGFFFVYAQLRKVK